MSSDSVFYQPSFRDPQTFPAFDVILHELVQKAPVFVNAVAAFAGGELKPTNTTTKMVRTQLVWTNVLFCRQLVFT